MSQIIIYTNLFGRVSIITPVGVLKDSIVKDIPEGAEHEIVDESALPKDRTFRDAWRKKGKSVIVDFDAAKEIAHDKRREDRDSCYLDVDGGLMHATLKAPGEEMRAKIKKVDDQLQADIDACHNVDELLTLLDKK